MMPLSSRKLLIKIENLIQTHSVAFIARTKTKGNWFTTSHIPKVVQLSQDLLKSYPEADKTVTILGAWLHDSGYFWPEVSAEEDHAVRGEIKAKEILAEMGVGKEMTEKVAHIVRAHRNRDVKPATIEAKIVAAADSASHFYGGTYKTILDYEPLGNLRTRAEYALAKLERDWQDVSVFPPLTKKLKADYLKIKEQLETILNQ